MIYEIPNCWLDLLGQDYDMYDLEYELPPRTVVSLETFFTGNDDIRSIGSFHPGRHPGTQFFYELLKNIRNQENVEAVLVEISEIEIKDTPGQLTFPLSKRVYIVTSASEEAVSSWVKPLIPYQITKGWCYGIKPVGAPPVSKGNKVFELYWSDSEPEETLEEMLANLQKEHSF